MWNNIFAMHVRKSSVGLALALSLIAVLGMGRRTAAQIQTKQHHHYKLVDLGTFGGPASYVNFFFNTLNNEGTVVGNAETTIPQPPTTNGFPCPPGQVFKAFEWQGGVVHNLGALPGGNCSDTTAINALGQIVGTSETDTLDPLTGFNEIRAVIWKDGQIQNLGTFGGNQSSGWTINNRGQVAGFALNDIPDPYSMFDLPILGSSIGTQTRAFIWQNGKLEDLGTLGGSDALGFYINELGQVAGVSYTNANPESQTGVPEVHPFLWQNGKMKDLGSFGGGGDPILYNKHQRDEQPGPNHWGLAAARRPNLGSIHLGRNESG